MKLRKMQPWLLSILILTAALIACTPQDTLPQVTPSATVPVVEPPAATPTQEPPASLVVCVGSEPLTLYPYGGDSRSMWSILEAIFDGPVDTVDFQPQPVILKEIPDLENGGAVLQPVDVSAGDLVLDAAGNVTPLLAGTRVYPAACTDESCVVAWDGTSPLQMTQMSLTYTLLDGLLWSDGQPLNAADSVYSYQLAADPATPVNKYYVERTAEYSSSGDATALWVGVPGFYTSHTGDLFWLPLPRHAWEGKSAADLLTDALSTRSPIGWGPYQISAWVPGSHIELTRNPNYFRAAEGLPVFETLVYRFLGTTADSNLKALEIGECDLVDSTVALDEQLVDVVEQNNLGEIKAYFGLGPEWEHLDFGIVPSTYDDGFDPDMDRANWFGDVRMRQAMAYCIDRQAIADRYFVNRSAVPLSFYPPTHPAYDDSLSVLPYDTDSGAALLQEMGWLDDDQNPATPRVSAGVAGVPDGTPLSLNYYTTQSDLRILVSLDIQKSAAACGIELNVQNILPSELYAPGPQGVMFGRNFDLAQFTWQAGRDSPCSLYTSAQIPNAGNLWVGSNVTGFQNEEYDRACGAAQQRQSLAPDLLDEASRTIQRIFVEELPVIPLYYQIRIAASRADFCGLDSLDVSSRSVLRDVESFGFGVFCRR